MVIRDWPCDGCGKMLPNALDISTGPGTGLAAFEAGQALAYCERCWNSFCVNCQDCEVHSGNP